jgi:hypothetical protein
MSSFNKSIFLFSETISCLLFSPLKLYLEMSILYKQFSIKQPFRNTLRLPPSTLQFYFLRDLVFYSSFSYLFFSEDSSLRKPIKDNLFLLKDIFLCISLSSLLSQPFDYLFTRTAFQQKLNLGPFYLNLFKGAHFRILCSMIYLTPLTYFRLLRLDYK